MINVTTKIIFTVDKSEVENLKNSHFSFRASSYGYYSGTIRFGFLDDKFIIDDDEGDAFCYLNVKTSEDVKKALEHFTSSYDHIIENDFDYSNQSLKEYFSEAYWDEEELSEFLSNMDNYDINNI